MLHLVLLSDSWNSLWSREACQFFYQCSFCSAIFRSKPGDGWARGTGKEQCIISGFKIRQIGNDRGS